MKPTIAEEFQAMLTEMKATPEYWQEAARAEVSDEIFRMMQAQKVSKAELARRLGTSRAAVTQMLKGNGNMTVDKLARVAFVLGYQFRSKALFVRLDKKK